MWFARTIEVKRLSTLRQHPMNLPHMNNRSQSTQAIGFLSLPPEVRQQIYILAVGPTRLCPFALLDPQWSLKPTEPGQSRGIPPFCLTCRTVYDESIALVYSKAILELAPARATSNFFYVANKAGIGDDILPITYTKLTDIYGFCRPDLLRLIKVAHIYSNQFDAIDGACYDSLLRWILENTSIVDVQVSSRAMVRIREQPKFDMEKVMSSYSDGVISRIVRLWTAETSWRPWEWVKINKLYVRYDEDHLPYVQISFWCPGQRYGTLHLDPRWWKKDSDMMADVRGFETGPRRILERSQSWIDSFMASTLKGHELACYERRRKYQVGDSWLYQMILVPDLGNA